jgi:predicted lipid-binding transport protein (Tim44 family)
MIQVSLGRSSRTRLWGAFDPPGNLNLFWKFAVEDGTSCQEGKIAHEGVKAISIDLILYAAIAVGLVFWLRSVLGTRHGDERQRPNPFAASAETGAVRGDPAPSGDRAAGAELAEDRISEILRLSAGRVRLVPEAEAGLREIVRADRMFDIDRFFQGAQEAFALIVEAFAKGDRATLAGLLAPDVRASFEREIAAREARGETTITDIHAVRRVEILEAALREGRHARVTVRFTADETVIVRDRDGRLVSGNPDRVAENIDIWVFGRDIRDRDPTWFLMETREAPQP